MLPFEYFNKAWNDCDTLSALHAHLDSSVSKVLPLEVLLRSEWVARLGALDTFIHEVIAQSMLEIFKGNRPKSKGYLSFKITNESVDRINQCQYQYEKENTFDLEIRTGISHLTYQHPDKIADGLRLCSDIELWNEVALLQGADEKNKSKEAKNIKRSLSLIVERRNQIAHESDLQTGIIPREYRQIDKSDLVTVKNTVENIVTSINKIFFP